VARTVTTIAIFMIVAGLLVDLWVALIGILVFFGARAEQRLAAAGELLRGLKVKDAMVTDTWGSRRARRWRKRRRFFGSFRIAPLRSSTAERSSVRRPFETLLSDVVARRGRRPLPDSTGRLRRIRSQVTRGRGGGT
jgi:hypothetical protein